MKQFRDKRAIAKKLKEWYEEDEDTCSGKPHCSVEECDLCTNCFSELCKKFGLKYIYGDEK